MPSNTDKQNDNLEQENEADEKFIAFKKRSWLFGIGCVIIPISVCAIAYFFYRVDSQTIRLIIFISLVLAVMSIWFYSATGIDNNRPQFVSSSIAIFGLFFALTFYPNQEFQENLKIFIVVVLFATFLFFLLLIFIHATFFSSKNPDIRQSVDFVSNHFAVEVLFSTLILGTLFGTIAFLVFLPDKDNSTFFGGIDIKNVALATAGLVTFFWAAKATKIKSIELEEKKQDGKRHDYEIAMAKQRDTAQLISEASKLLSSKSDAQKYAGLSFLNAVASDPEGYLRKEAFDLIADFILTTSDVTTDNKVRLRAILYADDLVGNNPYNFGINEFIIISRSYRHKEDDEINNLNTFEVKNLYISYKGLTFYYEFIARIIKSKLNYQFGFLNCNFNGKNSEDGTMKIIKNISAINCYFKFCKIEELSQSISLKNKNIINGTSEIKQIFPKKYFFSKDDKYYYMVDRYERNDLDDIYNDFDGCDFSNCLTWIDICVPTKERHRSGVFSDCFYYSGCKPNNFNEYEDKEFLKEIASKKQFEDIFLDEALAYSPPDDKK